ncbi:hypothetical protein GCM10022254_09190 [Actinomadura meridiana]|uniref:HNH endonuclease n=1 Tax=Actinomadura meridiana TaxID=559626 RepID=A0ABP8BTL7_9ACTN
MAKRTLLTEPHIYRQGGPRDSGTDTCRDCHQSFTTSWLHTDQALRFMDRVRRAEAERDRLAEQVRSVEALRDRWEAATRDPSAYSSGGAVHAAALAASHLPDLCRALDGTEAGR